MILLFYHCDPTPWPAFPLFRITFLYPISPVLPLLQVLVIDETISDPRAPLMNFGDTPTAHCPLLQFYHQFTPAMRWTWHCWRFVYLTLIRTDTLLLVVIIVGIDPSPLPRCYSLSPRARPGPDYSIVDSDPIHWTVTSLRVVLFVWCWQTNIITYLLPHIGAIDSRWRTRLIEPPVGRAWQQRPHCVFVDFHRPIPTGQPHLLIPVLLLPHHADWPWTSWPSCLVDFPKPARTDQPDLPLVCYQLFPTDLGLFIIPDDQPTYSVSEGCVPLIVILTRFFQRTWLFDLFPTFTLFITHWHWTPHWALFFQL